MKLNLIFTIVILLIQNQLFSTPTISDVYNEIVGNSIKFPEIVLAQSIKECGWSYDSYNASRRNNLFGMTGGHKCESNKYGYKIFENWEESVRDYKLWQDRRYNGETDYCLFLKRSGYFSSDDYCDDLNWILRELVKRGIIDECGL